MIDSASTTTSHPAPPIPSKTTTTSIPQQSRLTKKQKKALAFRDKSKSTKSKLQDGHNEELDEMADLHVPLVEKPSRTRNASASIQVGAMEGKSGESAEGRNQEAGTSQEGTHDVVSSRQQQQQRKRIGGERDQQFDGNRNTQDSKESRKRKREQLGEGVEDTGIEDGVTEKKGGTKKRKGEKIKPRVDGIEEESEGEEMSEGEGEGKKGKGRDKARFILFIGNLKYTTSVDTIKAHFSACDPPPEIRLLTPKVSSTGKTTNKSKGCAFLEFTNRTGLQQALKLHHSMLEGRMINVELTAGGGGKGEKRMEKLRERNKTLLGQRKKRAEKKDSKDGSLPSRPDKPQRYSATSGIEQSSPEKKRTWTVSDAAEDEVHRGGKKHKKVERTRGSRKMKMKDWATGVNAIPVG